MARRLAAVRLSLEPSPGSNFRPMYYTSDGEIKSVSFNNKSQRTLIIALSGGCSVCRRNVNQWKALVGQLRQSHLPVQLAVLMTKGLSSRTLSGQIGADTITEQFEVDGAQLELNKIRVVPTTILLDSSGLVQMAFSGYLDADALSRFKGCLLDTNCRDKVDLEDSSHVTSIMSHVKQMALKLKEKL